MLQSNVSTFDFNKPIFEVTGSKHEPKQFYQYSGFSTHQLLSAKEEIEVCKNMQHHALALLDILASNKEGIAYLSKIVEEISEDIKDNLKKPTADETDITFNILSLIDDVHTMLHIGDTKPASIKIRNLMLRFAEWAPPPYLVFNHVAIQDLSRLDDQFQVAIKLASEKYIASRNRMAIGNLRLVLSISSKYKNLGTHYDDLVQEGYLGLIKAVERFDYRLGYRFSTYAYRAIGQTIHLAVHKNSSLVRKPFNKMKENRVIERAKQDLEQRFGRTPSLKDIADHVSQPIDSVNNIIASQSLTMIDPNSDSSDVMDYMFSLGKDYSEQLTLIHHAVDIEAVRKKMSSLKKRDQLIMVMRFGIGCRKDHTLEEIAMQVGLTKERVRQIVKVSIDKLRSELALNNMGDQNAG